MLSLPPGAAAIYEESANLQQFRDDVACYPVPFDKLTAAVCPEAKLRKLVKNMIYVGVAAHLLKMDMAAVEAALRKQFAKKVKAADLNWGAVQAGYEYAVGELHQARSLRARADERDRRQDHHRRQRRRGARLHLCRLHGRDVVSDYAIVVRWSKTSSTMPSATASKKTARPPSPSCRQKTNWPQSEPCSEQAGQARAR